MLKYRILKNGYAIGQATGKYRAVERVRKELEHYGVCVSTWTTAGGVIRCETINGGVRDIFSIEKL